MIGRKPLVGLTGRRAAARILNSPRGFEDAPLDVYMSEYATSVQHVGGTPVHLALDGMTEDIIDHLDALIFSGGEDLDPRLYGQAPGMHIGAIDPKRDSAELALFRAAVRKGIPVLGICRGHQLINVARGGSLIQHLHIGTGESHASFAYPRAHRVHEVEFVEGSIAANLYGASTTVNSFHHQAVDRLGDGVLVTGRAPDGVIESIQITELGIVGVQWHPETFRDDPVFSWLIDAAAGTKNFDLTSEQTNSGELT